MKVTIAQLIEASRKNGYKWAKADYKLQMAKTGFDTDPKCKTFSCVVGQGLSNLAEHDYPQFPVDMDNDLSTGNEDLDEAFRRVYKYNDTKATSYADAFAYMEKELTPFSDHEITI